MRRLFEQKKKKSQSVCPDCSYHHPERKRPNVRKFPRKKWASKIKFFHVRQEKCKIFHSFAFIVFILFNEFVCKLGSLWHEWASLKHEGNERSFKGPRVHTFFILGSHSKTFSNSDSVEQK
jgi:hypothetical protein